MAVMSEREQADPDGRMPLIEHIRELRRPIIRALLGLLLGMGVGFLIFNPVWDFMKRPYCRLPQSHQLNPKSCTLIYTGITEGFFLHFKIALIIGAVISAPIWLYQLWAFVAPGLYRRDGTGTYMFPGPTCPLVAAAAA